jgi:hypothetical protein
MNQEIRLYYFACGFLWFTLSGFDYLLEKISSLDLHQRYWVGCDKSADFAEWLLNELLSAGDREDITEEEAKVMRSQIETLADPLVLEWAEKVRTAARDANKDANVSIDEEKRLYYFACGWSQQVLLEFDRLLKDKRSAELYERRQMSNVKSDGFAKWLQDELSFANDYAGMGEEEARALRATIETLAEQLATEWGEKVRVLSET